MHRSLFVILAVAVVAAPRPTSAAVSYPSGTTIEDAWASPSRITPDAAVGVLIDRFFAERSDDTEPDLSEEEFEAFKYLRGNPDQIHEEPSPVAGSRDYVSELSRETMTAEQLDFFGRLSLALSSRLGLRTASDAAEVCVRELSLFESKKIRWRVSGWNELEVWGVAAFARNVQYGFNNSDVVFGIFPFGFEASWWGGLQCFFDQPSNEAELRACGHEKFWQVQDSSTVTLSPMYRHAVPGVAQASLTYAGALLEGQAGEFRTKYQTRPSGDSSWLLGPSNTPAPSKVQFFSSPSIGSSYIYTLTKVVTWDPTVVLNVGYNSPTPVYYETYKYYGRGGGNPHTLGDFYVQRNYSRFHDPVTTCN